MLDVSFVDDDPKRTPGALTFKFGFGPDVLARYVARATDAAARIREWLCHFARGLNEELRSRADGSTLQG
jgi:hypothetical protein